EIKIPENMEEIKAFGENRLNDQAFNELYQMGLHYLETQEFVKAKSLFFFLTSIEPTSYDCWYGFGCSLKGNQEPQMAIDAFCYAVVSNPNHPAPRFQLIDLFFQTGDLEGALAEFLVAKQLIEENEEWNAFLPFLKKYESLTN
ncbi:hypothetical protein N9Y92_03870, partial [Chlamydiales bacterium]|nr:hypothetical protein [Chlamydiales bacterium]